MKKFVMFIAAAVAVFASAVTALAVELPECDASVMSEAQIDAFFQESAYDDVYQAIKEVYAKSKFGIDNNVFGMNFTATETSEEADKKPYGYYNADFELTASDDTYVMLIGNYGSYGTVSLGTYKIEAGKSFRVIKDSDNDYGTLPYTFITSEVGSFSCVAVPVTSELIEAYNSVMHDGLLNGCTPAKGETTLTLSLKLYETELQTTSAGASTVTSHVETGTSWTIGGVYPFTYHGSETDNPILLIHNLPTEVIGGTTYYKIELYAGIDSLEYNEVGFKIDASYGSQTLDQTMRTTSVYENMDVTQETETGITRKYRASNLGGKYMFGSELLFDSDTWKNDNTSIEITPYAVKEDGTEILLRKNPLTVTNALIEEIYPGSSLFKEAN